MSQRQRLEKYSTYDTGGNYFHPTQENAAGTFEEEEETKDSSPLRRGRNRSHGRLHDFHSATEQRQRSGSKNRAGAGGYHHAATEQDADHRFQGHNLRSDASQYLLQGSTQANNLAGTPGGAGRAFVERAKWMSQRPGQQNLFSATQDVGLLMSAANKPAQASAFQRNNFMTADVGGAGTI